MAWYILFVEKTKLRRTAVGGASLQQSMKRMCQNFQHTCYLHNRAHLVDSTWFVGWNVIGVKALRCALMEGNTTLTHLELTTNQAPEDACLETQNLARSKRNRRIAKHAWGAKG